MPKQGSYSHTQGRVQFTWAEGDGYIEIMIDSVAADSINVWKYGAGDDEQMTGRDAFVAECQEWLASMSKEELDDLAMSAGL